MSSDFYLPPRWSKLRPEDVGKLEEELARETCDRHPLFGFRTKALFRRYPADDVFFEVSGSEYHYACVHLTWSKETKPLWPFIRWFRSIEDFCENYEMTLKLDEDHPRWNEERWRFHEE